jgi:methionyl-tRNA formyltransferase
MRITILVDNPRSWFASWVPLLRSELEGRGHEVMYVNDREEMEGGDIAFLISCERVVPSSILELYQHNLVCHPSPLPEGKGFSPLAWQILDGQNKIPLTLFDAVEAVDAGPIFHRDVLLFEGHELNDEIKEAQGKKTVEMCLWFIDAWPDIKARPQQGEETFYPRRTPTDSELDPHRSIAEQFELFRVVDNERYPAFFKYRGHRYLIRIDKAGKSEE